MRVLELGRYRRARVWIDEAPDAVYRPVEILSHKIPAEKALAVAKLAAVELFVPAGPRAQYGLLGGHLQPDATGELIVEVGVSSSHERLFPDNLALQEDEVRVGFPAEYTPAIVPGLELAKTQLGGLAAGKLSIDCAAHASNVTVFKHLTATLVKLLHTASADTADEELLKLFPETLS